MTAYGPNSNWAEPVVAYLASAIPKVCEDGWDGWQDKAMTAWQFGCMALVAPGHARAEPWGATRLTSPTLPEVLPRWDDICVTVLTVAGQNDDISYRQSDGSLAEPRGKVGQFSFQPKGGWPAPPPPNIAAAYGCGPARVVTPEQVIERRQRMQDALDSVSHLAGRQRPPMPAPHSPVLAVLEALGLLENGAWTRRAELVMWRKQPRAWDMKVADDPRFADAVARCIETMPQEVLETLHDLVEVTAAEVDAAIIQQEQAEAALIAQYPSQARFDRTVSREGMFRGVIHRAISQIEHMFFKGWRFSEGWLDQPVLERALPLLHDPLVRQMRVAVMDDLSLAFPTEIPT